MRSSAEIDEFVRAFGRRVKSVREQKELTQLDLAIAAEMDVRQIQRIENGQINTSIGNIYQIAKGLNIPLKDLVDV